MEEQCIINLCESFEDRIVGCRVFAQLHPPRRTRMMKTLISVARSLRRILAAISAPCSVNAHGKEI
jgi:hypothetical protein